MTRQERRSQLTALFASVRGKDELLALYKAAIGKPQGECVTTGTLGSTMVEAILKHEFPNEGVEAAPAAVK
ncbi:MAG: hypothetical protein HYS13_07350 [Planctomycetia bacterium]|nr:hypothetical protein [Planctomycetia bacterium]